MTSLIAQGVCCCFACCCQSVSDALARLLGPQKVTKIYYLFLVAVFTIPAIVVLFYLNEIQSFIEYFSWLKCPDSSGGGQFDCVGPSAIYRMSLSILCLFALMMLVMLCRNRIAMVVNEGLFCVKYILVSGLFIGFLWVNNSVFENYSNVSQYVSILFMVLQSIILIDLFYLAGIKLVNHYDQGQQSYAALLIFLTLLFQAAAIALNVLGYVFFGSEDVCGDSLWVNIINTAILVALPVIQFFNFNKQNSLLTTAMVGMYVSYLSFICQFSFGGSQCVGRMDVASLASDIIVSTIFFIITMYGSIMGGSGKVKITQNTDLQAALGVGNTQRTEIDENQPQKEVLHKPVVRQDEREEENLSKYRDSWQWVKWHFYMCLASLYVGMLITNWKSASLITGNLISNDFGFWVRLLISWLTALLYVWTLLAPRICPNRDFEVV